MERKTKIFMIIALFLETCVIIPVTNWLLCKLISEFFQVWCSFL